MKFAQEVNTGVLKNRTQETGEGCMQNYFKSPRGSAIFISLVMMIGALALVLTVLQLSTANVVRQEEYIDRESSFTAAQGELNKTIADVWKPFDTNDGTVWPAPATGDKYADLIQLLNVRIGPGNATPNTKDSGWCDYPNPFTAHRVGDSYITSCKVRWQVATVALDSYSPAVFITVKTTAQGNFDPNNPAWHSATDIPATVEQTFLLGRQSAPPLLQFAALTKNISCSMCHTSFGQAEQYFNTLAVSKLTDPSNANATQAQIDLLQSNFGTFPRAKIGSLSSFQLRTSPVQDPDYNQKTNRFAPSTSVLMGSMYSRGIMEDGAHNLLSQPPPEALLGSTFGNLSTSTDRFDKMLGINIFQDSTGAVQPTPLTPTGTDVSGAPLPFGNLYLNYPTQLAQQTDGILPTDFPFPFQDPSPNAPRNLTRLVTPADVQSMIADRQARAADPLQTTASNVIGSLAGGYAQVVPTNGTYTGTSLPMPNDPAMKSSDQVAGSGVIDGNLILVGTKDNPVHLSNQVFVKGDIIIKGYYDGTGSLWSSGNIYLPSDVRYADKPMVDANNNPMLDKNGAPLESFGKRADGKDNLAGLIAGGTIIIGDYLTASTSSSGTDAAGNPSTDVNGNPIVNAQGKPIPTSNYVQNKPPDFADPGVSSLPSMSNDQEKGFPLVPTYQKADPNFTYNFKNLNPVTGAYDSQAQTLFAKNFTLSQLEIFNRDEWARSVKALPDGDPKKMLPDSSGAFTRVDEPGSQDSTFIPRYYVLNKGDPVNGFVFGSQATDSATLQNDVYQRQASAGGAEGSYWDDSQKMWKGSEMSKIYNTVTLGGDPSQGTNGSVINGQNSNLIYDPSSNGTKMISSIDPTKQQQAAVIALNPTWIPTDKMWSILLNEEWSRKSHDAASQAVYGSTAETPAASNRDGEPFRVDGLLYTNNAIFGIQRNRALAPQAPGDYQDATGVQPSDPTKPGSWPTPVPTLTTTSDVFEATQVHDVYSFVSDVDNYTYTQNINHYTRTPLVDTFNQQQTQAVFTRGKFQDQYTRNQYLDTYSRTVTTDTYSRTIVNEIWKSPDTPVRTVVWTCSTGTGYAQAVAGSVTQVSPPGTIAPPTTINGQPVTKVQIASDTSVTIPGNSVAVSYPQAGPVLPPPAGFDTKTSSTLSNENVVVGPYATGQNPGAPTGVGWGAPSSVSTQQTVNTGAYFDPANAPASPAGPGWSAPNTTTSVQTAATGVYYSNGIPATAAAANPPPPTGFGWVGPNVINLGVDTTTVTGTTITPPAGYTGAPTTTQVTATAQSPIYYTGGPTTMPGWTYVSTATLPVQLTTTAPYVSGQPAPPDPGNGFNPDTPPTTSSLVTAQSAPYLAGSTAPPVPAGYTKTTTVNSTAQVNSNNYLVGTAAPALPQFYTLVSSQQGAQVLQISLNRAAPYTQPATSPPGYHLVRPGNQTYTYPPTPQGKDAADFRRYAKEQDSSSRGRLLINGAVIAPDLGLLVTGRQGIDPKYPSNLIINYDKRVPRLISLIGAGYAPWSIQSVSWMRVNAGATNP